MTNYNALKTAGVDLDVARTTEICPVNSSTRIISWVCWPGESSESSWGSIDITCPIAVASGLVEGVYQQCSAGMDHGGGDSGWC